jgi:hypothetical protein
MTVNVSNAELVKAYALKHILKRIIRKSPAYKSIRKAALK